jgi:hypothetical protein
VPWRGVFEYPPLHHPVGFHLAQRLGEHLLRDPFQAPPEHRVPLRPVK